VAIPLWPAPAGSRPSGCRHGGGDRVADQLTGAEGQHLPDRGQAADGMSAAITGLPAAGGRVGGMPDRGLAATHSGDVCGVWLTGCMGTRVASIYRIAARRLRRPRRDAIIVC